METTWSSLLSASGTVFIIAETLGEGSKYTMYEPTKLYSLGVSWSSACEDLMYAAPFQLAHASGAVSMETRCLPQSVVASWIREKDGGGPSIASPRPSFVSFSCSAARKAYGRVSKMNDPRKNEGVIMLCTGAFSESSRSQTMMSLRLRSRAKHFPAASARMRFPRPFTAWITRNDVGCALIAALNDSGVMMYPSFLACSHVRCADCLSTSDSNGIVGSTVSYNPGWFPRLSLGLSPLPHFTT